jgi:signal transduction histidine kinase
VLGSLAAAGKSNVTIELTSEADLPPVWGDAKRLGQVFDNLIGNAIKFSPNGGIITVRLQRLADRVQIQVSDTGIGIPQEKLDKIWNRFYQVDSTSTRRFAGTGLGLAIVKRIVEAHRGTITVESALGQGSTFLFALPIYHVQDYQMWPDGRALSGLETTSYAQP